MRYWLIHRLQRAIFATIKGIQPGMDKNRPVGLELRPAQRAYRHRRAVTRRPTWVWK